MTLAGLPYRLREVLCEAEGRTYAGGRREREDSGFRGDAFGIMQTPGQTKGMYGRQHFV